MEVFVLSAVIATDKLLSILTTVIGLGLVIFFHELGHFAVAKWCDVLVERFSIGFGPILLRKKWGETEYALSAIPFGGYVKMLGQDDIDPSQMTDAQKAEEPRSYTAKNVWQRMAIISAGVIMNIITGTIFFGITYAKGREVSAPIIGHVQAGRPAWENGVRAGDRILSINGAKISQFEEIRKETFLSSGPLSVTGQHADGTQFSFTTEPFRNTYNRMLGLGEARRPELLPARYVDPELVSIANPGSPAAAAKFEPEDTILKLNGAEVPDQLTLTRLLHQHRADQIEMEVRRKGGETVTVKLAPVNFRTLGIRFDIGKVSAIRLESPARRAGIQAGDRLTKVEGKSVGPELDPFRLPDLFSDKHGTPVAVTVSRELMGGPPETIDVEITPDDVPAWSEAPRSIEEPLSIPSIGLAVQIIPTILSVEPESPAAKAGLKEKQTIEQIRFLPPPGGLDSWGPKTYTVKEPDPARVPAGAEFAIIPHAFWFMQDEGSARPVEMDVKGEDGKVSTVRIEPVASPDWYLPTTRGLHGFMPQQITLKGESLGVSMELGARETRQRIAEVFRTLAALIRGDLSIFNLSGPVGIAKAGYSFAQEGLVYFVMFLGLISVNLAVINFLPIPLLDGGHMLFLLYEGITGKKPSERVVIWATYIGLLFIGGLMMLVLGIDLFYTR